MTNPHIETLVNFLRDFADANADSFAPEQIEHLNRAWVELSVLDRAVDNLIKERDDAYAQIDRYKNGYEGGCYACEVVAVRNQELLAERDEVRREICERISTTKWEPQFPLMTKIEYAEVRGWDCFKERNDAQTNP